MQTPAIYTTSGLTLSTLKMSQNSHSEQAIRQRAIRKKKDYGRASMVQGLVDNFPLKELTTMAVEKQGVADIDYGGHHHTLNCTNTDGGKLTIGLCYENDGKKKRVRACVVTILTNISCCCKGLRPQS